MDTNMSIMLGLWIVTIATVPIYYWFRIAQRNHCKHNYQNYRVCEKCGRREKAVQILENENIINILDKVVTNE